MHAKVQIEKNQFWHHAQLNLRIMQAYHINYAYPPHGHDNYVICYIERGYQSFTHKGSKYYTPPNGLILINPGGIHTGEPASEQGFEVRSLYPSTGHMQQVMSAMTDRANQIPYFKEVRIDDQEATRRLERLHHALRAGSERLQADSLFYETMAFLIERYSETRPLTLRLGDERPAVQKVLRYLEGCYERQISLDELAKEAGLSPYHLLRVFQKEVGISPNAYLQDVRVRKSKSLIEAGYPLTNVAYLVGFSSQSHLTRRFKEKTGITPGAYAKQIAQE
ncbi:MAG: AraC family transcriptional regulator [Chloroflexota bacterium]